MCVLYVGTYSERRSKGIYGYRFDSVSGQLHPLGLAAEATHPSFLVANSRRRLVYSVSETGNSAGEASGSLCAYKAEAETGKLSLLNQVPSGGTSPCYVSLDRTARYVFGANFRGENVAVFPIKEDGGLEAPATIVQHRGSSVHARQKGPHPHSILTSPDNRFAIAADLGMDQLVVYRFDAGKGSILPEESRSISMHPGSGPRHFAFHPNGRFVYVINEIASTLAVFSYDTAAGKLELLQSISTLPEDFFGENDAADLLIDQSGRFLYASNRGHDSIAIFLIDKDGTLRLEGHIFSEGRTPYNLAIDPKGEHLLVANKNSDKIVVFRINRSAGVGLVRVEQMFAPSPVSFVFLA